MKLFVVTHKEVKNIPHGRILVGVGKNKDIPNVDFYDNTGDNIAEKNANYCELTALYWIWKNVKDDYVGLEHYRRFFCDSNPLTAHPLSEEKIGKILKKYDVILPKRTKAKDGIYGNYVNKHIKRDMDICVRIIKTMPEYAEDVDYALAQKKEAVCNMFVMSKSLADEYCKWLFGILFEAEKEIELSGRDDYEKRVFGFLSERLFNVWLYHKKLKIYYASIHNLGDCPLIKKSKGAVRRIKKIFKK